MNRLGASEGDMQLEQVRVCTQIGIECRDSDPKKRPTTQHIIERLDKTESADYSDKKADVEEQSEILEDVAEHLGSLHLQEGKQIVGQLPLWRVQDTKENVNYNEATSSSSMSTGMNELKYFDILRNKTLRSFDRSNWPTLQKSHLISIFRKDELKPILRSSNFIGKGDFAEVYKGVVDNTLVVVKKAINDNVHKNIELENEVIIQSQILHKNIVLLIGCCLEMDTPVLVYEFLPGSLHDILHSRTKEPLSLDVRLNIVAESAHGLAYMHSQAHTKILHGDVKPASILLDDNLVPKISDFGLSRVILSDKKNAYMDPGLSNEKIDVYSFGIVILEVISRKEATDSDGFSLVKNFLKIHKEGKKATELFDKDISTTTKDLDLVDSLADIAVECLNPDVQQRPSMTDVAERLRILNRSRRFHAQHIVAETRRADYSARTYISSSLMEQQKTNQLSLWGMQDTSNHGASISSSISTGFYKLSNLEIFNRKARRNFDKNRISTLQKSHFIKIFREAEIKPIINNSYLMGKGGYIDVYSGYLDDARVAVRRHRSVSKSTKNKLENEVIIMSQIIHKNIVKLIGYCLEKYTYVLVHEFISGETLHAILHRSRAPLNLNVRLTILAESAQGLAYLHSETHVKIWHCDVRSENILLDSNFIPKISGLHRMKLIQKDRANDYSPLGPKAYIAKAYIDPYYMSTGVLTEKSDVYSFGVVILEVISRREQPGDQRFVKSFLEVHKEGKKATELFDKKIAVTTGDLEILDFLAEIAVACLNYDVDGRPTMTSLAERLLTVQRYHRSLRESSSLPSARVTPGTELPLDQWCQLTPMAKAKSFTNLH